MVSKSSLPIWVPSSFGRDESQWATNQKMILCFPRPVGRCWTAIGSVHSERGCNFGLATDVVRPELSPPSAPASGEEVSFGGCDDMGVGARVGIGRVRSWTLCPVSSYVSRRAAASSVSATSFLPFGSRCSFFFRHRIRRA